MDVPIAAAVVLYVSLEYTDISMHHTVNVSVVGLSAPTVTVLDVIKQISAKVDVHIKGFIQSFVITVGFLGLVHMSMCFSLAISLIAL